MVNDCYYMLKEFPLVGFSFGSLPGLFSMVAMAKLVLITVPLTENYLPVSSFGSGANGQNCSGGFGFASIISFDIEGDGNGGTLSKGCC